MRCAALAALLALLGAGCKPSPTDAQAADWPAGTVLAVDHLAISATEVDSDSVWVERVEPSAAPPQLRRLALGNITLPRALARLIAPEKREQARAEAEAALARLRAGTFDGPHGPDGAFGELLVAGRELGLIAWGIATDLPEDVWSEVIEQPGHFVLLRRLATLPGPVPMATRVKVDALIFPWLDAQTCAIEIERAYDAHVLTIVDPAWRTIVPELTQSRMRKKTP